MIFDPNSKNIVPLYLAKVRNGKYEFRRYPMQAPYARVGENGSASPVARAGCAGRSGPHRAFRTGR